jgi:hypothetical protein
VTPITLAAVRSRAAVGHDKERRMFRKLPAPVGGDNGEAGFGRKRRGDELVAVAVIALNGKKGFAERDRARVDGNSGDGLRQRAVPFGRHRSRHCLDGPQRAHAASSLSAAATAS